ncbi:MAG: exodeoxyribonuclease VII small subunit [Methanomicrobiaceae archaeon]|nr:exodeoxyribonuclease VII small subunit [Methanomicrobiaceae archaeon]MDD5420441.1 exodeoxyribonuclease VII small subunit [Methanomicrobiaceae archaeon]
MTETYEELVAELREIVRKIEDGDVSLEEGVALYERGALLVKQCEDLLTSAEVKISHLLRE